jgi:hypothetical protein
VGHEQECSLLRGCLANCTPVPASFRHAMHKVAQSWCACPCLAATSAGELRGQVGRLEATVSADTALIADLRSRLATTETKLESELQAKVRFWPST